MRFVTGLTSFLLLASAPGAQTASDFYPLDEGNEWVYTFDYADGNGPFFRHDRIVGAASEGGVDYAQRERCDVPIAQDGPGTPDCVTQLVRIDADGDLVVRQPDGSEREEACALGAANGTVTTCDEPSPGVELTVNQTGERTVVIGYQEVVVAALQLYDGTIDPVPAGFAAGIGRLAGAVFDQSAVARFEYARVGDAEYGLNPLDPDPASFDPLAVGTVREYVRPISSVGGYFTRQDDVRTVELDGETWTLRRTQERSLTTSTPYTRTETRQLLRYDAEAANVLVREADGSTSPLYGCRFDLSPDAEDTFCRLTLLGGATVGGEQRSAPTLEISNFALYQQLTAGLGFTFAIPEASEADYDVRYIDVAPLATGDPLPLGTPLGDIFPTEIDPTPAHRYYPLSVGDEWHTEYGEFGVARSYQRRRIIGAETVGGVLYAVEEFSTATPEAPAWVAERTRRVRFDARLGFPVTDTGQRLSPCPLDEPVNANLEGEGDIVTCDEDRTSAAYRFFGPVVQDNGPTIPADTVKTFSYSGLANPVGLTFYVLDLGPATAISGGPAYEHLAYARVLQPDGSVRSFGAPVPVAGEGGAPTAALAVTASPNPTAGTLRLAIEMPTAGAVTVQAFDALGRRVFSGTRDTAVGALSLDLDVSGWAPGAYVVRVRSADGVATARVVRR